MKIINARAWYIEKKEMFIVTGIDFMNGKPSWVSLLDEHSDTSFDVEANKVQLMESTGLFDKNGKEIFEDDRLITRLYDGIAENPVEVFTDNVEWIDKGAFFTIHLLPNPDWKVEYEVIGTVYQKKLKQERRHNGNRRHQ